MRLALHGARSPEWNAFLVMGAWGVSIPLFAYVAQKFVGLKTKKRVKRAQKPAPAPAPGGK